MAMAAGAEANAGTDSNVTSLISNVIFLGQNDTVAFWHPIEKTYSSISIHRHLGNAFHYFWNDTLDNADEFASQLKPASDISVDAVMTSLYLNAIVFVACMATYEVLRRILPSVYAARKTNSDSTMNNTAATTTTPPKQGPLDSEGNSPWHHCQKHPMFHLIG